MDVLTHFSPYFSQLQWFAAVLFVPLVTWQYGLKQTFFCRWCALMSGYAVQIGFFLLLDDVGFSSEFLLLASSVAAYFWITTTVAVWPERKSRASVVPVKASQDSPQAST